MTVCNPERRDRAEAAADALAELPTVVAADVVSPAQGQHSRWTVECSLLDGRVPAAVVAVLAEHDLGIDIAQRQGDGRKLIAVA